MALQQFLDLVNRNLSSPPTLAQLFIADIQSEDLQVLQRDLQSGPTRSNNEISKLVESRNYFDGDWPGFTEFTITYLVFARDVNPFDLQESYPLLEKVFTNLQIAYSNNRGAILTPTVRNFATVVTDSAIYLDSADVLNTLVRTNDVSTVLLKMFNSIRGERYTPDQGSLTKKDVILYISVLLCRTYFKLNQPSACANVFSNIHTAKIQFSKYPRSERVTFRFYLGRFYFLRQELLRARKHLLWAFNNCLASAINNQRAILTYLIPTSLLLGIGARPELYMIAGDSLRDIFAPLERALKVGDMYAYNEHLVRYFDWFVAKKMFVLLRSKSEIILLRNLFRRINVYSASLPVELGAKKPDNITFDSVLLGIKLSTRSNNPALSAQSGTPASSDVPAIFPFKIPEMEWSYDDVENACISLIDQGLMKGNIYTRRKLVRLQPSGGFRPLSEVLGLRGAQAGDEEAWMDR
ncbi:hypothetical protein BZA70DRAFT_285820 [Myxozyma melibiosi]|uniref:PCI domain-containing protein n=1 Tax=Myxozyma melibiosi TaxID=54550 RepID=A0ABR1EXX2_9ASCO